MSSRALLCFDADAFGSEVEDPALVLSAVYEVPLLWAAAFAEEDLRAEPPRSRPVLVADRPEDPERDVYTELFLFETRVEAVHARIEELARRTAQSEDPWTRAAFAGCAPLASALRRLDPGARATLDARPVAVVAPAGVIREALGSRMRALAALRERWSEAHAREVLCTMRPDVFRGALSHDATRARRVTDTPSDRAAFFTLTFGTPSGAAAEDLLDWLAAAPPGPGLRPLVEEARLLEELLASRGVLRLADEGRADALRYLALAARLRTPAALREILDLLCAQGLVDVDLPPGQRIAVKPLRPPRPREGLVYDEAVLASIVQVLDAG